jgi:hypothetical protein
VSFAKRTQILPGHRREISLKRKAFLRRREGFTARKNMQKSRDFPEKNPKSARISPNSPHQKRVAANEWQELKGSG